MNPRFDAGRMPEPLRRFADLVRRWGERMQREGRDGRIARIEVDPLAMSELSAFAKAFTKADSDAKDEWEDRTPLDAHIPEQQYLDWLTFLVDELDLWPPTTIADLIHGLQRRGHLVMASKRAGSAMMLALRHTEAAPALPYLPPLTTDRDFRARVWSHCALSRITDELEPHRSAILAIQRLCAEDTDSVTLGDGSSGKLVRDMIRSTAAHALRVLDEIPAQTPET